MDVYDEVDRRENETSELLHFHRILALSACWFSICLVKLALQIKAFLSS